MGYEDFLVGNIDRKRREERLDRSAQYGGKAEERAKSLLLKPEYTIQPSDFFDVYGRDAVMIDTQQAEKKQESIIRTDSPEAADNARLAGIFEAITLEHAELSNWLGQDVTMLKTTLYDDYFNGVDLIAEWQQKGRASSALALAVDITFGARTVERKLQHIRRDIDKGDLGKIKYFKNADGSPRDEGGELARVVIGVTKGTVQELARLWVENDKKALGTHPIQRVLVEEIDAQLRAMQSYALARGQRAVADAYGRSLGTIAQLRTEKSNIPYGGLENNAVFREILDQSRKLFRT
jgi:hypothetical protein